MPEHALKDEFTVCIAGSKCLRTLAHRGTVMKFVKEQYPRARFKKIYDASIDGWKANDFHRCCDKQGWTLTIVETTKDFIFGGFTTAEWESSDSCKYSPQSFLFSVNEGRKYPLIEGRDHAICCYRDWCATFGDLEI